MFVLVCSRLFSSGDSKVRRNDEVSTVSVDFRARLDEYLVETTTKAAQDSTPPTPAESESLLRALSPIQSSLQELAVEGVELGAVVGASLALDIHLGAMRWLSQARYYLLLGSGSASGSASGPGLGTNSRPGPFWGDIPE